MAADSGDAVTKFADELTVIVTCAVLVPAAFDAVNVYVVVCPGATRFPMKLVTSPTPVIVIEVAPLTFQESCEGCPGDIVVGFAVNHVMDGPAPDDGAVGGGVVVADCDVVACRLLLALE